MKRIINPLIGYPIMVFWLAISGLCLLLLLGKPVAAQEPCARQHIVRRGEVLSLIAARYGATVRELVRLNSIYNPNIIRVGQVLCLPGGAGGSVAVVVEYLVDANEPESGAAEFTFGPELRLSKQLGYPIASGEVISSYNAPQDVPGPSSVLQPMLWLAQSATQPFTYTLVAIGAPKPLLDLMLRPTRTVTQLLPTLPTAQQIEDALAVGDPLPDSRQPVSTLLESGLLYVSVKAGLLTDDGLFWPVVVSAIDYQAQARTAKSRYGNVVLAVHPLPGATGHYRLLAVLTDGEVGPPGSGFRQRCASWRRGNWWTRALSRWYGC
jgi:LysM repeat protein